MKLTLQEAKAVAAFRKSPMAHDLRGIVDRELTAARAKYEGTKATEENRAAAAETRRVLEVLFTEEIEVEK